MTDAYLKANRLNWDDRADIHVRDVTGFYRIADLLAGQSLLTPIERAELGELSGKRIAHFQCHIGTDTISLERLGAASVIGLDFSPRAIAHARGLANEAGSSATFIEGSVYDAPKLLGTGYDMVFTSWGTICWLDDLDRWAAAIAGVLAPGGRFYFADGHPAAVMLEDNGSGMLCARFDFESASDRPLINDEAWTYDESGLEVDHCRNYEWIHSMSRILNALIGAGFVIERLAEYDRVPWRMFPIMERGEDGLYRLPEDLPRMPLALTITARKRA